MGTTIACMQVCVCLFGGGGGGRCDRRPPHLTPPPPPQKKNACEQGMKKDDWPSKNALTIPHLPFGDCNNCTILLLRSSSSSSSMTSRWNRNSFITRRNSRLGLRTRSAGILKQKQQQFLCPVLNVYLGVSVSDEETGSYFTPQPPTTTPSLPQHRGIKLFEPGGRNTGYILQSNVLYNNSQFVKVITPPGGGGGGA